MPATSSQTPEPITPQDAPYERHVRYYEALRDAHQEYRERQPEGPDLGDVLADTAKAEADKELVALPAEWDCAHGTSEDEPFCAEAEDEDHECPVIRVHRDDTEKFAALVDQAHEALADQERTTRYYTEQAKRRGDELKKLDRTRPTNDAYDAACKALWKHRDRADKAEAERDELKKRLYDAAMAHVWTNEDGKKFVFVEDITPALLGATSPEGGVR